MTDSRERAKALVMAGLVEVNGVLAQKPGHIYPDSSQISIKEHHPPYVSRGGLKLKAGLDHFPVNVKGKTILDIGASTGGFTDCLLQHGAEKVIAVDVGYGQLHWKLRQDPRVIILEKKNARNLKPHDLKEPTAGAVIDVSFISLKLVIPPVSKLLLEKAFLMALIKPQFEVGKGQVGKGGVVRDPSLHDEVIKEITRFCDNMEWNIIGHIPSPILGPKGNREFLIYMER